MEAKRFDDMTPDERGALLRFLARHGFDARFVEAKSCSVRVLDGNTELSARFFPADEQGEPHVEDGSLLTWLRMTFDGVWYE